ncbi:MULTISPECIES: response regulator transcription factor [Acidobacteriaceae]|uniref:response regulator n=1 Tax=Acidobacteriaceae TaxID=204434 RepID=UPI00131ADD2A|nr:MULTISPECIES: response regulator transcription factor [Acidobacteriaceae]MDW5266819.1 response regulator transcription factor [Edaphobacter sp.]
MAFVQGASSQQPLRIMIVEDNSKVRELIRCALNGDENEIIECIDGADALEAYKVHRPDVVLMDIQMPRLDGLSATRILREHDPDARVHILSDYDEDELGWAATAAGACGFTSKVNIHELDSILSRYAIRRHRR